MAIFKSGKNSASDRSAWDRKRHKHLVEKAIKENLGDIIAEESIIGQSKDKKIKIPIKGIKEYQFVYGKNTHGTGSGTGEEKRGQVIGKTQDAQKGQGLGKAGNEPGEDIYETEITLEELIDYLFDDLELPDMERKKFALIESEHKFKRSGHQRKGIPPRLDKKHSMIEKIKREKGSVRVQNELDGITEDSLNDIANESERALERLPFHIDDLRYHRVKEDLKRHSNAVAICIMDVSGSMDSTKKFIARSFYFLLYRFLKWKYEDVEVVFVAHTTEAKEVNEREFFHKGESGGTYISSGYNKALEIIEERYNPSLWNIYAFHCTDGDNWSEDNQRAITAAHELCSVCNLFGYGEIIGSYGYDGAMRKDFEKHLKEKNMIMVTMRKKEDIWPAFKKILEKENFDDGVGETHA